jgi:trehalose 6-phosphate phosphatase
MHSLPDLPPPPRAAYLLDFDGTLVDIAPAPDLVVVPPGLTADLRGLRALCGDAVAIVSGRPIAQIEALLGDAPYALAGEHGTAFRHAPGGEMAVLAMPPTPQGWVAGARALAAAHPGVVFEPKRHGFVLHYRAAPDAGDALRTGLQALLNQAPGYDMLAAKMAWEIRPSGADKATAVRAIMQRAPFAGRIPIFVGDDVTDEDGMRAARALGGFGLRVDACFGDPAGVRAWLAGLAKGVV